MKLLFKNIRGLVGAFDAPPGVRLGAEMDQLPVIENAWLAVEDGIVADFGSMEDWPGISDWRDLEIVDADGRYILPGYVDSHTHLVYAASREREFEDRIKGLSYQEIAARGGGILNSARKLAEASEDELFESALKRADGLIRRGTTAFEIKSGYGLTPETELKMLRVIRRLRDELPVPVKATFLGMHAVPEHLKATPEKYVDQVIEEMLPQIASEGLADYVDAFLEEGYFSAEQTGRLLDAAAKHGLKGKVHVNQFTATGGVKTCVDHGALSVDHLEELNDEDIEALKGSRTLPVALPSCSFFLSIPYTPARRIIDAGLPLVLASDNNPGSTPNGNMNLVISLACIKMKMTPAEAITASTINAAAALEIENETGSITPGHRADLILTKPIPSLAYLPYAFGEDHIEQVFVRGERY